MGNRAFITDKSKELGVYLHWNGGRDSVEAFLEYCHLRGFRSPEVDGYGWARLCQVVANFFGADGLSIGVEIYYGDKTTASLAYDNGVYVINNWHIVDRVLPYEGFEESTVHELTCMLEEIDKSQPTEQQLGRRFFLAERVPTTEIRVGDVVFVRGIDGAEEHTVVGFGTAKRYEGIPMIDAYPDNLACAATDNPNNYLLEGWYRRITKETAELYPTKQWL